MPMNYNIVNSTHARLHNSHKNSYHFNSASISLHNFLLQLLSSMHRVEKLFVFCATFVLMPSALDAIMGGRHAAVPPYDDPVVFVNHVGRFSRVEGYHNPTNGHYTFRGIRYADPPVRENRFLRPRSRKLSGDVDARRYAPPCPQPDYYGETFDI